MRLFVQGFRSVAGGQYIDVGDKITFFVGPNSSGKSAAIAAIEIMNKELERKSFLKDISSSLDWKTISSPFDLVNEILVPSRSENIFSGLNLNDIHKNPNKENNTAGISSVGWVWWEGVRRGLIFSKINSKKEFFEFLSLNVLNFFYVTDDENDENNELPSWNKFSCYQDDFLLFEEADSLFSTGRVSIFPFRTEEIIIEQTAKWLLTWLNKIEETTNKVVFNNISQHVKNLVAKGIIERRLYWSVEFFGLIMLHNFVGKERQRLQNEMQRYNSILMKYRKNILKIYSRAPKFNFNSVPAERVVPRSEDLKKILYQNSFSNDDISMLMTSAIDRDWPESIKEGLDLEPRKLIENVNRALSTHLFSDSGYQIVVKSEILISKDCFEEINVYGEIHPEDRKFYCELSLIDSHGRKLNFTEVGAGIGFVFPILVVCNLEGLKNIILQQPELHLHPALQASLADVLIEAACRKKIICETHSEHIILRALRRVRQTTAGTLVDGVLALKPEDLAFNYFEPMPDGHTKIHNLRVSEDGDFIDRWPNGFFAERDEELFGE